MKEMAEIGYHFKIEGIIGVDTFIDKVVEIDFPGERLEVIG